MSKKQAPPKKAPQRTEHTSDDEDDALVVREPTILERVEVLEHMFERLMEREHEAVFSTAEKMYELRKLMSTTRSSPARSSPARSGSVGNSGPRWNARRDVVAKTLRNPCDHGKSKDPQDCVFCGKELSSRPAMAEHSMTSCPRRPRNCQKFRGTVEDCRRFFATHVLFQGEDEDEDEEEKATEAEEEEEEEEDEEEEASPPKAKATPKATAKRH